MNFGVRNLLYVLSHTVFLCLVVSIYLQKISLQNRTEVYILKSTMQ